jgi:hypothetical protein
VTAWVVDTYKAIKQAARLKTGDCVYAEAAGNARSGLVWYGRDSIYHRPMHSTVLDYFNTPDSIEWRHRSHFVRRNGNPTGPADAYLVWDRNGSLIGETPSLRKAKQVIDNQA